MLRAWLEPKTFLAAAADPKGNVATKDMISMPQNYDIETGVGLRTIATKDMISMPRNYDIETGVGLRTGGIIRSALGRSCLSRIACAPKAGRAQ